MQKTRSLLFGMFVCAFVFTLSLSMAYAADEKTAQGDEVESATPEEDFQKSDPDEKPVFEPAPPPPSPSNKVDKNELNQFKREMSDVSKQIKDLQKQIKEVKGVEEWAATLKELLPKVEECRTKVSTVASDERRDFIDDCRSNNFWDTLNEIREEFVPPQELKNVTKDIGRQLKDLARFKKTLNGKSGSADSLQLIEELIAQITTHKNTILNSKGRDQRDAMQDFWNSNGDFNEQMNKIRGMVELPKQMKNISSDMKFVLKDASAKSMEKAFVFFGMDREKALEMLNAKKATVDQVNALMTEGKYDEAMELVEEDIHQGWHPGDARHLLGMTRETYDRMKGMKDKELKETVIGVVKPILEGFLMGDVRDARDTMVQFMDGMRKYEQYFRPSYNSGSKGLDKNMMKALDKVESLIQQKIEGGVLKKGAETEEDEEE